MTRPQIARETARALRAADLAQFPALLGFDGFVDDIIDVIAERPDAHQYDLYQRIPTLADFAARIAATSGHGTNAELVVKRQKLGGGAPIMGNALALLGLPVTCLGALGDGTGGSAAGGTGAELYKTVQNRHVFEYCAVQFLKRPRDRPWQHSLFESGAS